MWARIWSLIESRRRSVSRFVLVAAVLVAVMELWPRVPRETDLEFSLGPAHDNIVELRVAYTMPDGEELHGVAFPFPGGAPDMVRHQVSLPQGEFLVKLELRQRGGGSRAVTRRLITPADGVVRIHCEEG